MYSIKDLRKFFVLVLTLFCSVNAIAEGTKQLWSSGASNEKLGLQIWDNGDATRQFATFNCSDAYRLNVHVSSLTEKVYFGFAIDASAHSGDVFFQIKDPSGTIVFGPALVPTSGAGFIQSHLEAVSGPNILSVNGYAPLSYQPVVMGDHYIEFNPVNSTVINRVNTRFEYFDVSVVSGIQVKPGRLWSRNWDVSNFSFSNNVQSSFFVYSDDGVVSELDMNGIRPFGFEVACNNTGPVNTGAPLTDRQSINGKLGYPAYKIFLQDPDILAYPTGAFSSFGSGATYLSGCAGNYCLNVDYTGSGYAEVLLDFNSDGINNAADVLLIANVTAGYHCFPWDGRDANGVVVAHAFDMDIVSTVLAGLTHYPIYDAENHPNGFIINVIRPTGLPAPLLYFDDSNVGGSTNLTGCVTPCHTWNGNFGNVRTINTWWFGASISEDISLNNNHCDPIATNDVSTGFFGIDQIIAIVGNDSDTDGDDINVGSTGTDYSDGTTFAGGTVTINDNGTPGNLTDDFIDYSPDNGFWGLDSTYYILFDEQGGRDSAVIYLVVDFDLDQDGLTGTADLDSDNDGVLDTDEDGGTGFNPSGDADADGIPNYLDFSDATPGFPVFVDVNNDGTNDAFDSDLDGAPDNLDLDSDNDGIPDAVEANNGLEPTGYDVTFGQIIGLDTDNDGLLDAVDNDPTVAYGAGSTSAQPLNDTDGDGVNDLLDPDSDNDGIFDLVEAGGLDANNDGVYDGFTDANSDGYFDGANISFLVINDTDTDGIPNFLDLDSDGDGIDDSREAFTTPNDPTPITYGDSDGDGLTDNFDVTNGGITAVPTDTDNDGIPDYLDLDSDGDGTNDVIESNDANLDGIADFGAANNDADGDGLDDAYDTTPGTFGGESNVPEQNQDADSQPDWRDLFDTFNPGIFYYVCDATDELYSINPAAGTTSLVGGLGASAVEAIAYWEGVLYGANQGNFGTISTTTGSYTNIGQVDGGGTANGVDGPQALNDIDGLSFDPWTGVLWASCRRGGTFDLMFHIDIVTGQFVPNAFGPGLDYIVVDGSGVFLNVDDIAISPLDGKLFTVGNDGSQDQLLEVNKLTGVITVVAPASEQDVEGMAYYNDATFYGTVGSNPGEFWEIDPTTGNMTNQIVLPCGDPEAVAAMVAPPNYITGQVWEDINANGLIDGGESGIAGVSVNLYFDINGNGIIDPADTYLQTEVTDGTGAYSFTFATTGSLLMEVDEATLPASYSLTTDNIEDADFVDNINFNEVDPNNNFGAVSGPDCDGDGIPDFAEGGVGIDSDGDGVDNMCDLDSDNDGIPDNIEYNNDSDLDGIDDFLDLDSDNDGIPDALEANNGAAPAGFDPNTGRITGADSDGDGLLDAVDDQPSVAYGTSASTLPIPDNDGDGVLDFLDLDSDNDGITDLFEADSDYTNLLSIDANGDGRIDALSDGNGDGYDDVLATDPFDIPNTDGTTLPDYLDMDSDGDGIDDTREGLATGSYSQPTVFVDNNSNGIWDYWDNQMGGTSIVPVDTDNDGVPDLVDTDSDNDLVPDIIEGNDANMDGVADVNPSGIDADGDGIDDIFDEPCVGVDPGFSSYDYAEEEVSSGNVNVGSSDLEFNDDGGLQIVGLAFNNISIPQGATITSAFIQFQADEVRTGAVNITIHGEDVNNAVAFTNSNSNISNRAANNTSASQTWSPADWNTVGERAAAQQTTDLSLIVQEIVGRGGWVSGNNMNFNFTALSAANKRTAETFATLVVTFAGGTTTNTWGCATNTPHQDTDSDGEDDWRDIDDDNDNIFTANENGDIDGNGTPDYLEVSLCTPGFTFISTDNFGLSQTNTGVGSPNRVRFAPDASYANLGAGDFITIDMGQQFAVGDVAVLNITKISGGGNARAFIEESVNGTTFTNSQTYASAVTIPAFNLFNYTLTTSARFIRVTRDRRRLGLDAVTITVGQCEEDTDMDGIPNNIDEDDDNDGLSDITEGTGDFDGDGVIDALDLDSDNDGIPDAVEANAGVLPNNMTPQGQYTPAFIANASNDTDGDGWFESIEGGESYASNSATQLDSDGDFIVDRYDLDSDGDGILDAVEANTGAFPTNMDANGQYPSGYASVTDSDGDGIMDDIDPDFGNTMLPNPDTDNDGVPNYLDLDSDDDSIPDNIEGFNPDVTAVGGDADLDGIDNAFDADQGGTQANLPDEDCNLLVDYLDAIKNTNGTGNYTNNATWDNGIVPIPGKSIVVRAGHTLTLTGNAEVASVYVQAGAVLDIAGFELKVSGYFEILGDFIHNQGKINLNGTCTQTVCGDVEFYNFEINNSAGANMSCGNIAVANEWTLTDGIVSVCAANSFTMLSSASGTSYISSGGTGTVLCDITLERYKQGCADGWISLTSPFDNNTLNDWDDEITTAGFPGSDFPTFPFESILTYNEPTPGALTNGFFAPISINDNIIRGKGYQVYEGVANYPVVSIVDGKVDLTDFTFPLSYTNSGNAAADGWNLLGNPYPSAIDWDVTNNSKWINVGCCNATYIWNECVDQYASYISNVGTNGGTNVIPSSSAFWIKAHFAGASLTCTRESMTSDYGDFRSQSNVDAAFTMHIDGFSKEDEVKFRVLSTASHGHDDFGDALKSISDETNMGIYITDNVMGMKNSIEAFPNDGVSKTIPVWLRVPHTGSYTFDFSGGAGLPSDMCFIFEDMVTGNTVDLKTGTYYTFSMDSLVNFENRFNINVSYPVQPLVNNLSCAGAHDGSVIFEANGVGPYDVIWKDDNGVIVRQVNTMYNDTLNNIGAGDYELTVIDNGAGSCSNITVWATVTELTNALTVNGMILNQQCDGSNGSINATVNGGVLPYSYSWSNGETVQDLLSVVPGPYALQVTDNNGCVMSEDFIIAPAPNVSANFSLTSTTINLDIDGTVSPFNSSTATNYVWYWGDGNVSVGAQPLYEYTLPGTYEMSLVASIAGCTDTLTQQVQVVGNATDIINEELNSNVSYGNGMFEVNFSSAFKTAGQVQVFDLNGRLIYTESISSGVNFVQFSVSNLSSGMYHIIATSGSSEISEKIMVTD